jgi:hypothetical protein
MSDPFTGLRREGLIGVFNVPCVVLSRDDPKEPELPAVAPAPFAAQEV